ncbi:nucleotidyltransferase domain-containing protein [Candidatus Woesearchaeota archaeon]|nr:nucleotidyltransferase domain-containing protein [Candidatus Woesearchaeota archaeon]
MAKKDDNQKDADNTQNPPPQIPNLKDLPKETQEKLKELKDKMEKFQKQVLEKFDKYVLGISLLPPPKMQPGQPQPKDYNKDQVSLMVLVDDSDSKKMSKGELKSKLSTIIDKIAQDIDKNLVPQVLITSELWQSCYDAKYDLLSLMAISAPVFDKGMLAAIKIAEIHRTMVLKKFEKYIVSYVLFGSLTRGQATPKSDIDVAIIIDDTDVKRMTRAELKDKLRAIIIGMGIEAGEITGIKNKLNIQVYILTDFWDSIKEANPVIFTVLRDGVPLYDRGMFMPWKQLLKMGKIKPSSEAIDMFMATGEQMISRIKFRLKEIVEADIYWATLTPTQAAIMLFGLPPPTPNETIQLLEDIFVKKEKLLEPQYIEILKKIRKYYKDIEHGEVKEITGKEVDELLESAQKYLKRIRRLFTQIEKIKEEESMVHIYESCVTIIRDILKMEHIEKVKDIDAVRVFEDELVHTGKVPEKYLRMLKNVEKAKKDYDAGKLTKAEVENVRKTSSDLIKFLVEHMQRRRGLELERARIRVKHGSRYGEVILLDRVAFIIHDIDHEEKEITKAEIRDDGSLGTTHKSSIEEFEKHLAGAVIPKRVFLKEPIFENLKAFFGKDVEIMISY